MATLTETLIHLVVHRKAGFSHIYLTFGSGLQIVVGLVRKVPLILLRLFLFLLLLLLLLLLHPSSTRLDCASDPPDHVYIDRSISS